MATAATTGVAACTPIPIDVSLRNDIALAGSDPTNGTDDIYLVYSNDYGLTAGQLLVQNTTGLASKVIQFIGQDELAATTPVITADNLSRVFKILGSPETNSDVSVIFQGLVIKVMHKQQDNGGPGHLQWHRHRRRPFDRRRLGHSQKRNAPGQRGRGHNGTTGSQGSSLTAGPGGAGRAGTWVKAEQYTSRPAALRSTTTRSPATPLRAAPAAAEVRVVSPICSNYPVAKVGPAEWGKPSGGAVYVAFRGTRVDHGRHHQRQRRCRWQQQGLAARADKAGDAIGYSAAPAGSEEREDWQTEPGSPDQRSLTLNLTEINGNATSGGVGGNRGAR